MTEQFGTGAGDGAVQLGRNGLQPLVQLFLVFVGRLHRVAEEFDGFGEIDPVGHETGQLSGARMEQEGNCVLLFDVAKQLTTLVLVERLPKLEQMILAVLAQFGPQSFNVHVRHAAVRPIDVSENKK